MAGPVPQDNPNDDFDPAFDFNKDNVHDEAENKERGAVKAFYEKTKGTDLDSPTTRGANPDPAPEPTPGDQ